MWTLQGEEVKQGLEQLGMLALAAAVVMSGFQEQSGILADLLGKIHGKRDRTRGNSLFTPQPWALSASSNELR